MMCSTSAVPKLGTLRTTTLSAVQAAQLTAPPRVHVGSVLRLLTEAEREALQDLQVVDDHVDVTLLERLLLKHRHLRMQWWRATAAAIAMGILLIIFVGANAALTYYHNRVVIALRQHIHERGVM